MSILFSLPVHEEIDVIEDQIKNIFRFTEDAYIAIHISKSFECSPQFLKKLTEMKRVLVNPEQLTTSWGTGCLVAVHISNFNYASNLVKVSHIAMLSSNVLFVAHGVCRYINKNIAGGWKTVVQEKPSRVISNWRYKEKVLNDPALKEVMEKHKLTTIYLSIIEGSFYSSEIFKELIDILGDSIYDERAIYPKEEVYFATAVAKHVKSLAKPFTWAEHVTGFPLSKKIVESIRHRDIYSVYSASRNPIKRLLAMLKIYFITKQPGQFYSVKPVDRKLNDPIRSYIREQCR